MNVLMISGDIHLIKNQEGPFALTLTQLGLEWESIDVLCPNAHGQERQLTPNIRLYGVRKFLLIFDLMKFLKRKKYDLVVTHDYGLMIHGLSAFIALLFYKIPHISELHHLEGYPKATNLKEWFYAWWGKTYYRFLGKHFKAIRIVNKGLILNLLKKYHIPEEQILYLPSVNINLEKYTEQKAVKNCDVLFVGRLVPNKGLFVILESIKKLRDKGLSLRTKIKGEGLLEAQIKSYIETHKLQDLITIDKRNLSETELINLYHQAKVLVCASTVEGGPRVTLEAMACGIPVISTPCGIMPEVIKQDLSGLLFDGTVNELSSKLEKLFTNEQFFNKIQENSRSSVLQYDYKTTLKNYAVAYKKLVLK